MFIMLENKNTDPTSPEMEILNTADEVLDLRNQLLYERVGEEGMQALADHSSEKSYFDDLEAELTTDPESLALSALFEENDREQLSRDMFNGRGFQELNPIERQKVDGARVALDKHKDSVSALDNEALTAAARQRNELDTELNRVFVSKPKTGLKYDASRQKPGKFHVFADAASTGFYVGEKMIVLREVQVENNNDIAEARDGLRVVDTKTGMPIDMVKVSEDLGISKEDAQEWTKGQPLEPEQLAMLHEGLDDVKEYLHEHLSDPNTPRL
jgi:hypothetical protein